MAQLTERELRDKRRGLEALNSRDASDMDLQRRVMATWRDDDRPSAVERYNAAKAKLDKLDKQIQNRVTEIKSIEEQLNQISTSKQSDKDTKDVADLKRQLQFAKDTKDTTKQTTLEAQIKTIEDRQKLSATGGTATGSEQYAGDNEFVKDVYIYIGEESRPTEVVGGKLRRGGSSTPYTPSTSNFDALRKRIIEDAIKSPRGLKGLFDDLRGAGLRIPNNDYNRLDTTSVSFGQALSYALQKHTKAMVNDLEINKNIQPKSFFKYVQEDLKDSGIGGPEVDYDEYVTKRDEADSDLNRFFMDYLGRNASDAELNKYYKELRALEKKNARVTTKKPTDSGGTSTISTGEYQLDPEDILQLQRKIAGKALDGSDIDTILKGGKGAAQAVNNTLAYAKKYGVALNNSDALKYVSSSLKNNEKDTRSIQAKILAVSKATYSNLSDILSEDVDLDDLSANYKYTMRQILEIPESQIDTMNPTIQLAL